MVNQKKVIAGLGNNSAIFNQRVYRNEFMIDSLL